MTRKECLDILCAPDGLCTNISDMLLRTVLADEMEESGDEMAAKWLRWMYKEGIQPGIYPHWGWYEEGNPHWILNIPEGHPKMANIPARIFEMLNRQSDIEHKCHKWYHHLEDAMMDLLIAFEIVSERKSNFHTSA